MFGFINIYKPVGKTSHDIVAILRKIIDIKQIGHTGTLDPFAEGVLPVAIGKATRLIEYLEDDKAYIGTVKLGIATDTYDKDGKITKTSDKYVSFEDIDEVLDSFRGEIYQKPPIYSAIKMNGKKLYEYARNNQEVEIKERKVNIYNLEILGFNEQESTVELLIECSKGTYIRSIANDLGEKLGCFGHLIKLERIKAGKFTLSGAIKLEDLKTKEDVYKKVQNPLLFLNYPKYTLDVNEHERFSHGIMPDLEFEDEVNLLIYNQKLVGIVEINNEKKSMKVFNDI